MTKVPVPPSNRAWSMGLSATVRGNEMGQTSRSRIQAAMKATASGNPMAAVKIASEVLKSEPRNAAAHLASAMAQQQLGKTGESIAHYRACIEADPSNQLALTNLGALMVNRRQPEDAVPLLKAALRAQPENGHAHHFLGRAYGMLLMFDDAVACLEAARRIFPQSGEIAAGYARALSWAGRIDEALKAYDIAERLSPDDDSIPEGRAKCLIFTGRASEAEALLRQAIAKNPSRGAVYQELARIGKLTSTDIAAMQEEIKRVSPESLSLPQMLLAMGSFHERNGDANGAWKAYTEAAAILDCGRQYDKERAASRAAESIAVLDRLPDASARAGLGEDLIFIVGMPRSGTTLIEETLSRHSQVFDAGERSALPRTRRMLAALNRKYPQDLDRLTANEIADLRAEYRRGLPADPRYHRFTDKLPDNAHHLALIQVLFPAAKILISRRHPLDICLSILAQGFGRQLAYATSLKNIASNMVEQERVIARWRSRFGGTSSEIFYEELVTNWEVEARRLIEAVGLAWEPACLTIQSSARLVQTVSAAQVRQPVYKSSIGRWKPFADALRNVERTLRPLIDRHESELAARGVSDTTGPRT